MTKYIKISLVVRCGCMWMASACNDVGKIYACK